jgi:hypothetical protein
MKTENSKTNMSIKKIEKKQPQVDVREERYFLVDFTLAYLKDGTRSIINDTVGLGAVKGYPNKTAFSDLVAKAYGITEESGCTDIGVFGIRPWTLSKEDYEDFTN